MNSISGLFFCVFIAEAYFVIQNIWRGRAAKRNCLFDQVFFSVRERDTELVLHNTGWIKIMQLQRAAYLVLCKHKHHWLFEYSITMSTIYPSIDVSSFCKVALGIIISFLPQFVGISGYIIFIKQKGRSLYVSGFNGRAGAFVFHLFVS